MFYHRKRKHAALGCVSPVVYEEMYEMNQNRAAKLANQVSAFRLPPQKKNMWAGLDSNQRRLTPMGLQPIPFSHSGTDPNIFYFITLQQYSLLLPPSKTR